MGLFKKILKTFNNSKELEETQAIEVDHSFDYFNKSLKEFSNLLKNRSISSNDNTLYMTRTQDKDFLEEIIATLNGGIQNQNFESSEHPEMIAEEILPLLRKTLYNDFVDYGKKTNFLKKEKKESFKEYEKALNSIKDFSKSLKKSLDFYLVFCNGDRSRISKHNLPLLPFLEQGNYDIGKFYFIIEQKKLGDNFDYSLFQTLAENSTEIGINNNPTISQTYEFIDRCMYGLTDKLENIMKDAKTEFKIYKFKKTESYEGIQQIYNLIKHEKISVKSAEYYLNELDNDVEDNRLNAYKSAKKESGLNQAEIEKLEERYKEDFIGMDDIKKMRSTLNSIINNQSSRFKKIAEKTVEKQKQKDETNIWTKNFYNQDG